MKTIFSFDLSLERRPAQYMDLPPTGFVRVLRCDDFATIHRDGPRGIAVQALPGLVLEIGRALFLKTLGDAVISGNPLEEMEQRGVLLLEYHESSETIPPNSAPALGLNYRQLVQGQEDNASVAEVMPPVEDGMYVITGVHFGYGSAPADGNVIAQIQEQAASNFNVFAAFVGTLNPCREIQLARPIYVRPGLGFRTFLPASGTAGVDGFMSVYGGMVFV